MVEEFHKKFDTLVHTSPTDASEDTKRLRIRLIGEEFDEPKELAEAPPHWPRRWRICSGVYGTAVSYGIDMSRCFERSTGRILVSRWI
jgi:hypothetical protein